jgi:hypothetical protein
MANNSGLVVEDSVKVTPGAVSPYTSQLYSTILAKYGLDANAVGKITFIDTDVNPPLANVDFGRDTIKIHITALEKVVAGGSRRRQRKSRRTRKSSRKSRSRSRR